MPHRATGPISLAGFSLGDMLRCGVQIRRAAAGAGTLESAARALVEFLHGILRDPESGRPSCVLLRCFVTLPYGELPPELQEAARASAEETALDAGTRCLVLLATAGERPEWNDRRTSVDHRAIPLPSPEALERAPMIARLFSELGVAGTVFGAGRSAQAEERTYNVFYVPEAGESPHILAQDDFVRPYGVRSVVGFGGVLQEEVFVFVLFSREAIPEEAAGRFRNVALDARIALLRHEQTAVFDAEPAAEAG